MNTFGTTFAYQTGDSPQTLQTPPPAQPPLPDREWGLTAPQVVAVVLTIIAACELIGIVLA